MKEEDEDKMNKFIFIHLFMASQCAQRVSEMVACSSSSKRRIKQSICIVYQ